ncbi:MAG TPA: hypothetical protein VJT67_13675 [Longimicrobiaceae bacterium]|nr:hypothetical protein [Longimicrobiaceae bacterium]
MVEFPHIPVNGSADLDSLIGTLELGEHRYEVSVDASVALAPDPRIVIGGSAEPKEHPFEFFPFAFDVSNASLFLESSLEPVELLITQWSIGEQGSFRARIRSGNVVVGSRSDCDTVVFGLLNFPDVLAQEDGEAYLNSFDLHDDELGVEIQVRPTADPSTFSRLKEVGGYGLTHLGFLKPLHGNGLEYSRVCEVLDRVQYFLSFCSGAWTPPFLARGIVGDQIVWHELSNRLATAWPCPPSWLDRHNAQAAGQAYPGFCRVWANADRKKALTTSLYWYLRSNSSSVGVDGALVLTQAALEHLAWHELVEQRGSISGEGFERLPAADQLRLLLSAFGIPGKLPEGLEELARLARELDWDGPAAFTEIRNNLVHPGRKRRRLASRNIPYFEAWGLGQWYLELALLRMFNFNGVYHDRTRRSRWVGDVVPVPWAS